MSIFSSVKANRPRYNKFDLSHDKKLSASMGLNVPIMVQEIVPGDKFRVQTEIFMRMAPMLAPIMHRVNVFTHYFFVPNRLVWSEWEDFITGGREGTSSPVHPFMTTTDMQANGTLLPGDLSDYMGIPTLSGVPTTEAKISALPFRAYQLIWDEYYRDQNLQASLAISKASGQIGNNAEMSKLVLLRKRAWEKDYFTSCLPWQQRGAAVEIPGDANYANPTVVRHPTPATTNDPFVVSAPGGPSTTTFMDGGSGSVMIENIESIGVNVNNLRRSIRLQEWLERNARGGARYIEQILSHFGVLSSDARLQRPEYLGGGKASMQISEVLQTVGDFTEDIPLGQMGGHGVAVGRTNGFKKSFEEHGFVIGIMSVLPRTAYQQGIPRFMFQRFDKLDYYWPEFANIGEQEVFNGEIFYNGAQNPNSLFGYQSRYADMKYGCSTVHGVFRDELNFWHMGRIFGSAPSLNASFVESDPTSRIFAVGMVEQLYAHLYNRIDAIRPMPYFGTPTI